MPSGKTSNTEQIYKFTSHIIDHAGPLWKLQTGTQRTRRGTIQPTDGFYGRLPLSALHITNPANQSLDPSSSTFRKIGSVTPAVNSSGFAYTATTTTITWYWDGTNGSTVVVITRADNSRFTVPTSGSGLTISGLTANTKYYFLPFWNPSNTCNIGWVTGTTGSPQIAFVAADVTNDTTGPYNLLLQGLQKLEPLSNGYMSASTTASGSGGGHGGGGGGSGSGCVMSGTDIVTLGDLPYSCEVLPETTWISLTVEDGRNLCCTFDHPLYHEVHGKVQAHTLKTGDPVIMENGIRKIIERREVTRKCSKWNIVMADGHLFWANGFLSHNFKFVGPGA